MSATQDPRTVTVIVPVRDGAALLDRCLSALDRQDHPHDHLQVIVVDNRSVEDIAAVVAQHPGVLLLHQPDGGSYAARNLALRSARGEVLAFTDADCDPAPDWVSSAAAGLAAPPRAAMVGGAVELTFEHGRPVTACELFEAVQGFPQEMYLRDYHFAVTANMVTWRETFDLVGEFDGTLMSGGDTDWGRRVHAAGGEQRYVPTAVVRHPARATWGEAVRKWRRVADGRLRSGLGAGWGRYALAQVVWWEGKSLVQELAGARRHPQLVGPLARGRYLLAHSAWRGTTALLFARAFFATFLPRRAR